MWYVQVFHTFFSGKQGDEEDSEDGGDHGRRTANAAPLLVVPPAKTKKIFPLLL